MLRFAALALPLALAACGGSSITINDADGNVAISTDGNGVTSVKVPGVDASIKLPKIDVSEANFDVNGVKLYPDSKVKTFNLDTSDRADENKGRLSISFESPASLAKVQAWFRDNMAKRGFKVAAQGTGFAGTTDEGEPITLELEADGPDKARGKMSVGT